MRAMTSSVDVAAARSHQHVTALDGTCADGFDDQSGLADAQRAQDRDQPFVDDELAKCAHLLAGVPPSPPASVGCSRCPGAPRSAEQPALSGARCRRPPRALHRHGLPRRVAGASGWARRRTLPRAELDSVDRLDGIRWPTHERKAAGAQGPDTLVVRVLLQERRGPSDGGARPTEQELQLDLLLARWRTRPSRRSTSEAAKPMSMTSSSGAPRTSDRAS